MTNKSKILPWMMQASNDIEDAYAIAIEKETYVTEPAALDIAAIISEHFPAEAAVPDGWKLVPTYPTDAMADAFMKDARSCSQYSWEYEWRGDFGNFAYAFGEAIKAAPLHRYQPAEAEHE